jgi:GrpB-like predicted nucleotidyltransferase (UPF0157 family)
VGKTEAVSESQDDHLDALIDAVVVGGREEYTVEIVAYTEEWPARYEAQRRRIAGALGLTARRIEHIGSTAGPGLAAKPIVDIMVTVDDPNDETAFRPPLETVGYILRVSEPDHRMFRTAERDIHVHIWGSGGDDEDRQLLFRDHLRAHERDRSRYEEVKRSLAGHCRDMGYYAEAKSAVIEEILQRAVEGSEGGPQKWADHTQGA